MSNDPTIRVDPPAAPKGKRRPLRALGVGLCTFVLLLLGFSISSSLGARVSTSVLWLLLLGLGACVIVPALLGFWLRRVGRARERPRTLTMLCLCNALLVVVAAISAPSVTRAALSQHGAWWVESLARVFGAKDARNSAVVVKARALYSAMASVLPGSKVVAGSGSASATGSASGSGASPSTAAAKGDAAAGTSAGSADAGAAQAAEAGLVDAASIVAMPSGRASLRFEKRGTGIVVPVRLYGPTRELSAKMLFDTGATLTTITPEALGKLGLFSSASDATIITRTANGRVRRSVTVIDGVSLGKAARVGGGVAVVLCEPCGSGEVIGLLGLNVSRHFRVTLDHDAGEMTLEAKRPDPGHLFDIRPFVKFGSSRGLVRGPKMTITGSLQNLAPRALSDVRIEAKVSGGRSPATLWTVLPHVAPRSRVPLSIEGLLPTGAGRTYSLSITRGGW